MPSVRSTTASRSPRAAHRSSENQYGPIMAHAVESVLRRPILVGLTEGLLSTSRYRRLRSIRLRPAPTGCVKWILQRVRGGRETPKGIRSHVTILQDSGNY